MTALFNRSTFAVVVFAIVVTAALANGQGPQNGSRIDVAALMSRADIATLPVVQVEQPF